MHQLTYPDPVLFLFQFTPCQTQNCYAGEACCHMCFVLLSVLFSSTGTDSSELLTSLGVDTASIEWTAQPLWIVVNLVCFLFVLCHSQDDSPALCREMQKGISGCSTLTKLSVHSHFGMDLPPQYSTASVRAAVALQSSLTEVEWIWCSFDGKSDISVTVLVCGERQREGRKRLCICICVCLSGVHGCMFVCACGTCPLPALVDMNVIRRRNAE